MASPNMSLKLLVDKKGQRVLFAEATKEFVDFLFHIFSLPLGTLIEFLGSKQMVGCLGKLADSIRNLSETYLQSGIKKDDIFKPKTTFGGNTLLLSYDAPDDGEPAASKTMYRCSRSLVNCYECGRNGCKVYVAQCANAVCPACGNAMNEEARLVVSKKEMAAKKEEAESKKRKKGGYVKKVVTYMVMDDLVVKPMSTISSITLINNFGVKDLSHLEEKMVSFSKNEALRLLKASLTTDKALTAVFLHNSFEAIDKDGDSVANKSKKRTRRN